MTNERENFKKDLEDVLNSYVHKITIQDILSELYPLLKHTEFKYSLMLRDLYLKENTDSRLMHELSDEEIEEVWKENYGDVNISNFARAILKKANEK